MCPFTLLSFPGAARLNRDLHRVRLRMCRQSQRLQRLRQREPVAVEPCQVHLAAENKIEPLPRSAPRKRCRNPASIFSSTHTAAGSITTSPRTVCANNRIRPPNRAASIAGRISALPPTARITASAPRPSVRSRMCLPPRPSARRRSTVLIRSVSPIVSRCGNKSEVITCAPARWARNASISRSAPGRSPARFRPASTPSVSIPLIRCSPAHERRQVVRDIVGKLHHAARSTIQSITRMYSEKPPPHGSPKPAVTPTLLYAGTLRKHLALAVVALAARNVMEDHHALAELEIRRRLAAPRRHARPSHVRRCAARSATRSKSSSDPCRRCRRNARGSVSRRARSPAPAPSPDARRSRRDTPRPAWFGESLVVPGSRSDLCCYRHSSAANSAAQLLLI